MHTVVIKYLRYPHYYMWFTALPIINQRSAKICQAQLFIISRCRGNVTPPALVQCHLC